EKEGEHEEALSTQPRPATPAVEPAILQKDQDTQEVAQEAVPLPQEELDKLESELQLDINIDKALDLDFNPVVGGGTLFALGAATGSGHSNLTIRRTETVSSHSRYSTPSEGPSDERPTGSGLESNQLTQDDQTPTTRIFSDIRSVTSTKA